MSGGNFTLIRPITVDDSILTTSTILETAEAEYNSATTYGAGDYAGVTVGTEQTIYLSLESGNLGNLPSASTAWSEENTVFAQYVATAIYALGDVLSNISTATNIHLTYESLVGANQNNALTDTTKWLELGATNRWKMFDTVFGSQSERADTIVVTLTPGELVNAVALLNIDAASVTVAQSISGYSETRSLNAHPVLNWYDWYYEEIIHTGDVIFSDIPPYAAAVLTITIDNTGDTARLGVLVIGKARELGETETNPTRTINDYSVTEEDSFGNVRLVQRSYSKRLNLAFKVEAGAESEVTRILELYRATPMVFVGSDDYSMTIIYGFLGAWEVPISADGRLATATIKGLI